MNRKEYLLIAVGLSVFIPFSIMVIFWWSFAALTLSKIIIIPDEFIKISAMVGLCAGIIIDILFIKKLISRFYKITTSILIVTYIFSSILVVSFFMGLPIGNIVLGIIAGIYIGRRFYYTKQESIELLSIRKSACEFTALVTSIEALFVGLFMLTDKSVIDSANQVIGVQVFSLHGIIDIMIIIFLSILLYVIQYFLTKVAVNLSYHTHMKADSTRLF